MRSIFIMVVCLLGVGCLKAMPPLVILLEDAAAIYASGRYAEAVPVFVSVLERAEKENRGEINFPETYRKLGVSYCEVFPVGSEKFLEGLKNLFSAYGRLQTVESQLDLEKYVARYAQDHFLQDLDYYLMKTAFGFEKVQEALRRHAGRLLAQGTRLFEQGNMAEARRVLTAMQELGRVELGFIPFYPETDAVKAMLAKVLVVKP